MLQNLINKTSIDSALLFEKNGSVIDSLNLDKAETIAALSNIVVEMCQGLVEELNEKKLNQVILKGDSILIIGTVTSQNQYLIAISYDVTKLGLLLKVLENLEK